MAKLFRDQSAIISIAMRWHPENEIELKPRVLQTRYDITALRYVATVLSVHAFAVEPGNERHGFLFLSLSLPSSPLSLFFPCHLSPSPFLALSLVWSVC